MFLGLLVLAVGIIFLLQNLGYISANVWSIIWPAIVIIAGLSMVFRGNNRLKFMSRKVETKNKK